MEPEMIEETEETADLTPEEPVEETPVEKKKHPVLRVLGILAVFLAGVFCGYQLRDLDITFHMTLTVGDRAASVSMVHTPDAPETTEGETVEETQSQEEQPWNLVLVNPWNPIEGDFAVELTALPSGKKVDARCYEDLKQMLADCAGAGHSPVVCSAYRSVEEQTALYNRKVGEYLEEGMTQEEAQQAAATIVAVPGTSEHHLGLAVDIVDERYQVLDEAQEQTGVQQWLMEHSWEYGFILRYPNGTTEITGIVYEPWHYRYVGREAAAEIHGLGVTFEEYLASQSMEQ